ASSIGGSGNALNTGRMYVTLKPRNQRDVTADQIIRRLQPKLDQVQGAKLYLQAAQDVRVGGRASRTQYQYTLQDSDRRAEPVVAQGAGQAQDAARAARRGDRPA